MKNRKARSILAFVISVFMVLGCISASMPMIALAASDWVQASGTSYEYTPVTIYVQTSSLTAGQTYLIGVNNTQRFISNSLTRSSSQTRNASGATSYYSKSGNNYTQFTAGNYYIVDETNTALANCEWERQSGNYLYNADAGKYLSTSSSTSNTLQVNSTQRAWTFSSNRLSTTVSGTTYNLRYNSGYSLNTGTYYTTITLYQKSTVYKRTSVTTSGYYKNDGPSEYNVYKNDDFTAADVESGIVLQHKANASDTSYTTLSLGDDNSTLTWDKTFTTATAGTYTATLKVGSTTVDTITVTVSNEEAPALTYKKYTPKSSGQILDEGIYVFWNEGHTRLMLGKAASGGEGIAASATNDFTISGDNLSTNLKKAEFTVTVANAASNTYYIQASDGRYVSVGSDMSLEDAALTTTRTAVKVITSGGKIAIGNTSGDRYLNCYDGDLVFGVWEDGMNDENNRFVAYKAPAGNFIYNGQKTFFVEKDSTFNESLILNAVSVLYQEDEESGEYETLTINDPRITLRWNETVDTSVKGDYTATVYANGSPIATLTVTVSDEGAVLLDIANDPSTSNLKSKFPGVAADDGKILTDKTVKYGDDEFNAFGTFENDEFSIALSALGQSYRIVETEEVEGQEKIHPDVVFVIDASGSMRQFTVAGSTTVTRAEATAEGLNEAIKELYAVDPETRIGIVTYGFGVDRDVYLPLDKYTLPEGQTDYITWGGRNIASSGTANTNTDIAFDIKNQTKTGNVSNIKTISNNRYPGVVGNTDGTWTYTEYTSSQLTLIATTAEGISYYGLSDNSSMIYLFASDREMPIAYMTKTPGSSSNNANYTNYYVDDYIKITCTGTRSVSYVLYDYQKQTGNVKLTFENDPYVMATNFLINSKGETVKPSTHHFTIGIGTFTQSGLQAAENMFAEVENKENRIPSIILLSDGIPTVSDTNTTTPHLNQDNGVTVGYGLSVSPVTSQDLCDHGLRTIETAMSTKETVDSMYTDKGEFKANFYTIGPGVDYIFGQTILNPTNENIAAAAAKTTNVGEDTESGVGVPSDLAKTISSKYTDLDYVDYADWSFTGDMSSSELTNAFVKIAKSISSVSRPIKAVTMTTSDGQTLDGTAGMKFTDTIGDGMELRDEPVLSYGGKTFRATSCTTNEANGKKVETYRYNYNVTEASTGKTYTLNNAFVNVIHDTTGEKEVLRVEWYIPAELVPVIYFDEDTEQYSFVDPIRVVYKVGIADKSHSGTYYANSVENPATSEFTPAIGNPYYYNNEEGEDGKMHSTLKTNNDKVVNKTDNETDTLPYAWNIDMQEEDNTSTPADETGRLYTTLGNNGVESLKFTQIDLTKIWEDGNDVTGQRPDSITVQVYRNGAAYGDPRKIMGEDCETYVDEDGNDVWHIVIDGLPYSTSFDYTIDEIEIPDHDTYITTEENETVIVNRLKRGKIEYELYLVDRDGNPIDNNGNSVTFDNRTVMSDLVEVEAYINTTTVIDLDELEAILPAGYMIYNPETSYTENFKGAGSLLNTASVVDDEDETTHVFYPTTAYITDDGAVTGLGDFSDIKVAFAIFKIELLPDVVVVDYGKPITSYPLEPNSVYGFGLTGITASAPANGVKLSDKVTLNNGVARLVRGNSVELPAGKILAAINDGSLTYFYPSTGTAVGTNDSTQARYLVSNTSVIKYAANSSTATTIAPTLAEKAYVTDGDYCFYHVDGKVYVVSGYTLDRTDTTTTEDYTYTGLTGNKVAATNGYVAIGNKLDDDNGGAETGANAEALVLLCELPDGTKIYGLHNFMSSVDSRYVYIYDDSVSTTPSQFILALRNLENSGSFEHTVKGAYDENGNPLKINVYITKQESTGTNSRYVKVEYDGYGTLTGTRDVPSYEEELRMKELAEDTIVYSPFKYMSSIDRVYFYVDDVEGTASTDRLYSTVTFIPATLVYYEDDFGGEDENGGLYIKYTGDWYTITDNGTKTEGVTANTDIDDRQDRGDVGEGYTPYGYDSSYDNSVKFSNGNAAMATGKVTLVNGKPQSNATAEFTFTGTGFDIISRTDLDCGMISVVINKHDTGDFYDSVPVINKGVNNLYQIPVISYEGAPYDTYDVKITVNAPSALLGITGSNFYLDAIRIYNPMGLESADNAEFDEANAAYNADKEANAFTQLIRNCLISADKLDVTENYGAVYVDTLDNDYAETGSGLIGNTKNPSYTSEEIRTRAIDLEKSQNFETIGPNEEVYLSPGYGVGFIAETTVIPEAVHLEIKLPAPLNNGATLAAQTYGDTKTIKNITINSATEMYYDITDAVKFTKDGDVYKATVILSNGLNSSVEGDIVAITNLKMTYSDDAVVNNGITTASVADAPIVTASLKANRDTYVQVYDTIYVQHLATTPNYDIVNAEADENVSKGEQVTVEFNTANSVENVTLTAADGKAIELTSLDCDVDESKLYTDDFQNTKSWTATFTAETEGELEYTVSAANGDGETANLMLNVAPAKVVSIKVAKAPAKTNYNYGEKIDTSGLVLEATYSDGSVKQIRSGYTLSNTKANHLGQKTITVSFDGQTAGFKIKTTFSLVSLIKSIFSR